MKAKTVPQNPPAGQAANTPIRVATVQAAAVEEAVHYQNGQPYDPTGMGVGSYAGNVAARVTTKVVRSIPAADQASIPRLEQAHYYDPSGMGLGVVIALALDTWDRLAAKLNPKKP